MFTILSIIALLTIAFFGGEWSVRIVPRKKKGVSSSFKKRANAVSEGYENCLKQFKNPSDLSDSVISLCPITMDILITVIAGFVFYNVARFELFNVLRAFWATFVVTSMGESLKWADGLATASISLLTAAVTFAFFHCRMISQVKVARGYFKSYIVLGKRPIVKEEISLIEALLKGTGLLAFFRRVIWAAKETMKSSNKMSRTEPKCA